MDRLKAFTRHIVRFRSDGNAEVVSVPKDMKNEMGFRPGDFALLTLVDDCIVMDRLDPNAVRSMEEARAAVKAGRLHFGEGENAGT